MASCVAAPVSAKSSSRSLLSAFGILVAVALGVLSFRGVPVDRIGGLLGGLGAPAVLLLVPWIGSVTLESWGFRAVFRTLGVRVSALPLLRIRVATDALGSVLPMGALVVEALKPRLLERHAGVRLAPGLAGIGARKYLLVLSQAAYLGLGFVVGGGALRAAFGRLTGVPSLAWLAPAAALALAGSAWAVSQIFAGGVACQRVLGLVARVPLSFAPRLAARLRADMERADETLAAFFRTSVHARGRIVAVYLGAWLLEATETWLILHTLGSSIGWGDAVGVEALVMLARNVFVILPGGLGAQELGYATLLVGIGGDLGMCGALALLKRARELLFVFVGGGLLAQDRLNEGAGTLPARGATVPARGATVPALALPVSAAVPVVE